MEAELFFSCLKVLEANRLTRKKKDLFILSVSLYYNPDDFDRFPGYNSPDF